MSYLTNKLIKIILAMKLNPYMVGYLRERYTFANNNFNQICMSFNRNVDNKSNLVNRKECRRELRTYGTSAEACMWRMLQKRQIMGLKFRRQFSIGPFILDFYCASAKLCIELDGMPHYTIEGEITDTKRTEYLDKLGIKVLRFENHLVFDYPGSVVSEIENALLEKKVGL
jgi:very-short-patch-repair endonuclease